MFYIPLPLTIPVVSSPIDPFVVSVIIFVLAIFIGFEVITKVPSTLHTPLMSGSNAISGITLLGALICSFDTSSSILKFFGITLGLIAVVFATINVVGGYVVTQRMLRMFKNRNA